MNDSRIYFITILVNSDEISQLCFPRIKLYCLQDSHFIASYYENILSRFHLFSAYFDIERRVTWLANRSPCVMSLFVLTDVERERYSLDFMCRISSWILLNGVKWAVLEGVQDVVLGSIRPNTSLQI